MVRQSVSMLHVPDLMCASELAVGRLKLMTWAHHPPITAPDGRLYLPGTCVHIVRNDVEVICKHGCCCLLSGILACSCLAIILSWLCSLATMQLMSVGHVPLLGHCSEGTCTTNHHAYVQLQCTGSSIILQSLANP